MPDLVSRIFDGKINEVAAKNRAVLGKVTRWMAEDICRFSVCGYGIPESLRSALDLPVGESFTYTDAMLRLSGLLRKPVQYLEVGVSVGKNFLQAADFLQDSVLVGFDIERINPVLEGFFTGRRVVDEWRPEGASASARFSLTEFFYPSRNNRVFYLCADLRDESAWKRLEGFRFNLLFSDAVHVPKWVLHEQRMIARYGLRDSEEFVTVWDDLAGPMRVAFDEMRHSLEAEGVQECVIPLNGWLGSNEPPHTVGFIAKLRGPHLFRRDFPRT